MADETTLNSKIIYDKQFFYDQQLLGKSTSVRIYAPNKNDSYPICRAILQSGYGYNIKNSWGDSGSILDTLINLGIDAANSIKGPNANLVLDAIDTLGISNLIGLDEQKQARVRELANSHFYSVASKLKMFNGTEVSYSGVDSVNLLLIADSDNNNNIIDVLDNLLQYCIGDDISNELGSLKSWVGIQAPPNGYTWSADNLNMDVKHIDNTLVMFIGDFLIVENLLVSSVDVKFSTQTVMEPGEFIDYSAAYSNSQNKFILGKPTNNPLYATVSLGFEYARVLTRRDLTSLFINKATDGSSKNADTNKADVSNP